LAATAGVDVPRSCAAGARHHIGGVTDRLRKY
jgi:hypothetical protein